MNTPERTANAGKRIGGPLKRRGLLAGALALAGAAVERLTGAAPAQAGHDGTNIFHLGEADNVAGALTTLSRTGGPLSAPVLPGSGTGLRVRALDNAVGIEGLSYEYGQGVLGETDKGIGVYGVAESNGTGVNGQSQVGTGVIGNSGTGIGVYGDSSNNVGVRGISGSVYGMWGSSQHQIGVRGDSFHHFGLYGYSEQMYGAFGKSAINIGVRGESGRHFGVYGLSAQTRGVVGWSQGTTANAIGVHGIAKAPGFAGQFDGNVVVNGSFTVAPGFAKSVAVDHPDGTPRRMYCLEASESWLEDVSHDRLSNGRVEVKLDLDFAAVVQATNYEVFLTPYDATSKGLAVVARNRSSFVVQELAGGTSNSSFGYRVMAKRKDLAGPRMEKVPLPKKLEDNDLPKPFDEKELPKPPEPKLPPIPNPRRR